MIRRLVLSLVALALLVPALVSAQVFVPGYLRRDGTYVQPHYRSYPDGNPYNNYGQRQGIDTSIYHLQRPIEVPPPLDLGALMLKRQEIQLRQLQIEEYRRRLYGR